MTNTNNTAALTITIHGVLAGAYKARRNQTAVMLYHASLNQSDALCAGLKHELCDWVEGTAPERMPTCPKCIKKVSKLLGIITTK